MKGAVHVCLGCAKTLAHGSTLQTHLELAKNMVEAAMPHLNMEVHTFPCLGGCTRKSRFSISGPLRWSWLFGNIDTLTDQEALVRFVRRWAESSDGLVPNKNRSPALRPKILGRLPVSIENLNCVDDVTELPKLTE